MEQKAVYKRTKLKVVAGGQTVATTFFVNFGNRTRVRKKEWI